MASQEGTLDTRRGDFFQQRLSRYIEDSVQSAISEHSMYVEGEVSVHLTSIHGDGVSEIDFGKRGLLPFPVLIVGDQSMTKRLGQVSVAIEPIEGTAYEGLGEADYDVLFHSTIVGLVPKVELITVSTKDTMARPWVDVLKGRVYERRYIGKDPDALGTTDVLVYMWNDASKRFVPDVLPMPANFRDAFMFSVQPEASPQVPQRPTLDVAEGEYPVEADILSRIQEEAQLFGIDVRDPSAVRLIQLRDLAIDDSARKALAQKGLHEVPIMVVVDPERRDMSQISAEVRDFGDHFGSRKNFELYISAGPFFVPDDIHVDADDPHPYVLLYKEGKPRKEYIGARPQGDGIGVFVVMYSPEEGGFHPSVITFPTLYKGAFTDQGILKSGGDGQRVDSRNREQPRRVAAVVAAPAVSSEKRERTEHEVLIELSQENPERFLAKLRRELIEYPRGPMLIAGEQARVGNLGKNDLDVQIAGFTRSVPLEIRITPVNVRSQDISVRNLQAADAEVAQGRVILTVVVEEGKLTIKSRVETFDGSRYVEADSEFMSAAEFEQIEEFVDLYLRLQPGIKRSAPANESEQSSWRFAREGEIFPSKARFHHKHEGAKKEPPGRKKPKFGSDGTFWS